MGIMLQEPWYVFDLVQVLLRHITGRQDPHHLRPEHACLFAFVVSCHLAGDLETPLSAHLDLPDPLIPLETADGTGLPNGLWRIGFQRTHREPDGEAALLLSEAGDAVLIGVPAFFVVANRACSQGHDVDMLERLLAFKDGRGDVML